MHFRLAFFLTLVFASFLASAKITASDDFWTDYVESQLSVYQDFNKKFEKTSLQEETFREYFSFLSPKDGTFLLKHLTGYSLAPTRIEKNTQLIGKATSDPLKIDFYLLYRSALQVNGKEYPVYAYDSLEDLYLKQIKPKMDATETSASLMLRGFLFPIALLSACDMTNMNRGLNSALAAGSLVNYCLNPNSLAIAGGVAACRALYIGCKRKSLAAGFEEFCKKLPVRKELETLLHGGK